MRDTVKVCHPLQFICVNVGYGIGAGIIIDGKPLYGPMGMAGEFGHITLDKDSEAQCDCAATDVSKRWHRETQSPRSPGRP